MFILSVLIDLKGGLYLIDVYRLKSGAYLRNFLCNCNQDVSNHDTLITERYRICLLWKHWLSFVNIRASYFSFMSSSNVTAVQDIV